MKTPVCEICSVTGELCSGCQQKMDKGELGLLDVKVAELLHKHNKRFGLGEVTVSRALDLGKLLILFTETEPGLLIGKAGKVVNQLSKDLGGRHVRVIHSNISFKQYAAELLLPVKPLGINIAYKSGGEEYRVRIARKELPRLPTDLESLKRGLAFKADKPVSFALE